MTTAEVRAERDRWRDQWAAHRQLCSQCSAAARARRPRGMCDQGAKINQAHADAQAALSAELAAGRQPIPGQTALFVVKGE